MSRPPVREAQIRDRYVRLTARQREVIELLARGHTNGEIAEMLGISLDGAKYHVSEILGELGVDSREQAGDWWREYRRPGARLERAFRSLLAATSLRVLAGVAGAGLVIGIAILAAAAFLSREDDDGPAAPDPSPPTTPDPTETVGPDDPPFGIEPGISNPAFTTAPLLVYADRVDEDVLPDRVFPIIDIVSYDTSRHETVASFRIGPAGRAFGHQVMELAGRTVLAATEAGVVAATLDGSDARLIYAPPEGAVVTSFQTSPDARYLAIGTEAASMDDFSLAIVAVVEIESGTVVREFPSDLFQDGGFLYAAPGVLGWDDSGTVIHLWTLRHKGGAGETASLHLDGRLEMHEGHMGAVTPDRTEATWTVGEYVHVCEGIGWATRITAVKDTTTGVERARIELPGHVLGGEAWSPDGSELLLSAYALSGTHPSGEPCWDPLTPSWYLWDGDSLTPVANVEQIVRQWHGHRFIERTCPAGPPPIEAPWQVSAFRCDAMANTPPMTLSIDGHNVGTVRDARLLGFIDAAN